MALSVQKTSSGPAPGRLLRLPPPLQPSPRRPTSRPLHLVPESLLLPGFGGGTFHFPGFSSSRNPPAAAVPRAGCGGGAQGSLLPSPPDPTLPSLLTAAADSMALSVQKTSSGREYNVKDLSQADFGRLEIDLAEVKMPGLMACSAE